MPIRILQLKQRGTQKAIHECELNKLPLLGRGMFCAVYDKGNTVMKLTADNVQHAYYTDPQMQGKSHVPRLVKNHGVVGKQNEHLLYLVEMEKLKPFGKRSECPDRAWASRRKIIAATKTHKDRLVSGFWHIDNMINYTRDLSAAILHSMSDDSQFSAGLRDSFHELARVVEDTNGGIDFHNGNFMLRGKTLVLNDVVSDVESFQALKSRKQMYDTPRFN